MRSPQFIVPRNCPALKTFALDGKRREKETKRGREGKREREKERERQKERREKNEKQEKERRKKMSRPLVIKSSDVKGKQECGEGG